MIAPDETHDCWRDKPASAALVLEALRGGRVADISKLTVQPNDIVIVRGSDRDELVKIANGLAQSKELPAGALILAFVDTAVVETVRTAPDWVRDELRKALGP